MTELPRGTVTFLFTDIEGSTRLLRQLGRDAYDELLVAHREIVEAAVAAHEGRVVETQGDSFFVAFGTAADGVGAAIDVQRDLAAYPWPEGAEFKVRMGLHTGEPKVGAERYVGVGVHKAARIGAAGHGGQVLLSSTTKELAEDDLPVGISIRDLGERRLKDFERPERIFQLLIEGLESAFAQLKTLDVELGRRRRRMYAGSALIGVLAAAVAIPIFALGAGSPGRGQVVNGNAVAVIDPWSNRVSDQVPVGAHPQAIALGSGGLWVANLDDGTVSHIDPQTEQPTKAIAIGAPVSGLAPTDAAVWAVSIDPTQGFAILRKIDPRYQVVTKTRRLPASFFGTHAASIVTGTSGLWVGADGGLLTRLNPTTGAFARTVDTNNNPGAVAEGAGAVWIADAWANNVVRVDGTTSLVTATIPVGNSPSSVTVGEGGVWVADTGDDAVVRIDPNDNTPTARIPVGRSPTGIAVGYGAVWVANSQDGTVSRIDPSDNRVSKTITVGGSPQKIAVGDRRVWVTVQRAVPAPSHVGGVVRIDWAGSAIDSLDPGIAFSPTSWEIAYATCAELLNYPDRSAPAESRLEPEIAAAVPAPTNGGKTYTFVVRKGFHFSPPSNEAVTARNFAYAIERALSPRLKSDAKGFLSDVVGFSAYEAGRAKHISGVTASGDKLTIRLTRAAPDFLARITMPFFCPVPLDTPVARNVRTVPGAGPYYVTSYTPDQDVVLKQNPSYRGPRPHAAQEIDLDLGTSGAQAVHEVEAGQADFTQVTPQSMTRLASRYGPKSAAAKAGHQRYFVNTGGPLATNYLALNTSRPLFADTRLRRAVNYALNRRRLARIGGFGSSSEAPTDQLLPPGLPGFHDVHIYPYSPDLKKARRLARGRGGHAVMYTCNDAECHQGAQVIQANLKAIGIDVEVKTFPFRQLFDHLGTRGEPFDIGLIGWVNDYPDPYDFLNLLLSGATIKPTGNSNFSYFDDPTYNHKLAAAARLSGPRRYLAYGKLDAELARDAAPYAALWNYPERDFFSARMGCETYQPVYGVDLAALCIRHR